MDSVITPPESVEKSEVRPTNYNHIHQEFAIHWSDIVYNVPTSSFFPLFKKSSNKGRTVLKNLNGSFRSSEMTALMGPSGAGKSTLLECIAGVRVNGRKGKIRLYGRSEITMAFIPQHDFLNENLTVRESLMLASRLQHSRVEKKGQVIHKVDHRYIVKKILEQLNLEIVAEVKMHLLSGGQRKRVSIGQELVSKPQILMLDEPTSGLDSSSCFSLLEMLDGLTRGPEPMAILMTIHQPSARVFNMFHKIYILSVTGRAIYEGHPSEVVATLARFGVNCSQFYNPADLIIEVAFGDYGLEVIQNLANNLQNDVKILEEHSEELESCIVRPKAPFWRHFGILWVRFFTMIMRDPIVGWIRLFIGIAIATSVGLLFRGKGPANGCPPTLPNPIAFSDVGMVKQLIEDRSNDSIDNVGSIFFLALYATYANLMPKTIFFPLLVKIFQKERLNGWYKPTTYYWAATLSEVPLVLVSCLTVLPIYFYLSETPFDRFWHVYIIFTAISFVAQSHGLILGTLLCNNVTAAVFLAPNSTVPLILLSGFLIKIKNMPVIFQFMSNFSYLRFCFEGLVVGLFGFDRCDPEMVDALTNGKNRLSYYLYTMIKMAEASQDEDIVEDQSHLNKTREFVNDVLRTPYDSFLEDEKHDSQILTNYGLVDAQYFYALKAIGIYYVATQIIVYLLLKKKSKLHK